MAERIQYLLILLLVVLTGSLESSPFPEGPRDTRTVLTQPAESDTPDTVRNYLSVWSHSCDFQAETPVVSFDHKTVVRQRAAVRSAVERLFETRFALCMHAGPLPADRVDYYVYSLERILI